MASSGVSFALRLLAGPPCRGCGVWLTPTSRPAGLALGSCEPVGFTVQWTGRLFCVSEPSSSAWGAAGGSRDPNMDSPIYALHCPCLQAQRLGREDNDDSPSNGAKLQGQLSPGSDRYRPWGVPWGVGCGVWLSVLLPEGR